MSASTGEVWPGQQRRAADGSSAWVGVLLFIGSSVVSVKTLGWLGALALGAITQ